ncbi:AraC family transcriptional regulator [Paenibacillus eucommiae]|uniref:AraC-like DNA-binding protein n=1 Tax=Paenibacillus eucommiae TaxID=1355755 RepID=A0ABS4IN29_9BACL|nr:AraC family transcriptional regulator [Paenibacillus eucommiae]MBP1988570.1 AraC-like DNA-binding protein [Paenibacillus eucommiae]
MLNRFLYTYISYFLIILIASSIVVINLARTSHISNEQDKAYYESNLIVVKDIIETTVGNVRNLFLQMANNNRLESFRFEQQLTEGSGTGEDGLQKERLQSFAAYEAINELFHYKNMVKGLQLAGVFYKQEDFVIDNFSTYPADEYFKQILKITGFDKNNWYGLASSYQNFNILPYDSGFFNGKAFTGTTFYKTIPANDSNVQGMIFAVMSRDIFTNALDALSTDGQTYGLILDENNQIVASTGNYSGATPILPYTSLEEQGGSGQHGADGYDYYVAKINSIPWKVVLVNQPLASSFNGLWFSQSYMLLFAIILLASLAIAYLLSRYSYKPLQQLYYSMIPTYDPAKSPQRISGNAFGEIESRIVGMKEQQAALIKQIHPYNQSIKHSFLYSIIKKEELLKYEEVLDDFEHKWAGGEAAFTLVIRTSVHIEERVASQIMAKVQRWIRTKTLIFNAVHDYSGQLVLLAWLPQGLADQEGYYREWIQQFSEYTGNLESKYKTRIFIGISGLCYSMNAITQSVEHALISLRNNTLFSKLQYVGGESPETTETGEAAEAAAEMASRPLPLPIKMKLLHHLKMKEFEQIAGMMQSLLPQSGDSGDAQPTYAVNGQMLYFELIAIALKHMEDSQMDNSIMDKSRFSRAESIEDVLQLYKEICASNADISSKDTKKEIIAFINEQFASPDMSLQMVKEQFHISFALITRMVKSETGFGFLEYVSRLRVDYAKALLKQNEGSISRIREISGFNDDSTFIKVFKKYEGVTPGDYKRNPVLGDRQARK